MGETAPRAPPLVVRGPAYGVELVDTTFGILGKTALLIDGGLRDEWGRPKERAVLGALLLHAGRWVSVDTLIQWAWPEETTLPRNRAPTFHHYATRIRKFLLRLPSPPTLYSENGGYRLDVDKSLIDYYQFSGLLVEARAHARRRAPQQTVELVRQALGLWRGRPLEDLAGEPAQVWRMRVIQDEWLAANATLLTALIDLGEFDEVLSRLGDLQTDHPHDVTLATLRLSALHGLSRHADETAYYFNARRRLLHDGDDPAAEHLRRHHEGLLARATQLDASPHAEPVIAPRQLRHDIADFVGREDLLAALDTAATDRAGETASGVVILDGMAGVGKTALAMHWGHRSRQRFPDGDFYVDLNGFSDTARISPSTVVDDFLIALGNPPDRDLPRRSREILLNRLLADRRTLVILDNARDTAHVKDLVQLLSGALVLVTSRQRLSTLSATTGARRVRVEPMPQTEATELLSVRIGTRRQIAHDDRTRLVTICGGLPLMIALLAEHVATRPASQMPEFTHQLDRRQLIVDIGEDGDGPANAQTFFTWSYRALAAADRRLFRMLGLHPGPDISMAAACACDGRSPAETTRSLRALVGAHLLEQPDALDRYRFHDLIREFATHCAESDEQDADRQAGIGRIASFYLASATHADQMLYPSRLAAPEFADESAVEPAVLIDTAQAKSWFDRERTNLIAAVRYAATQGRHEHAWRLADSMATFFNRHGYYDDTRAVLELAVDSARVAGHRVGEATSLSGLGMAYLILGEHTRSRQCLDAALRMVEDDRHEHGQAAILNLMGRLEMQRGDPVAALGLYRRSLDIAQRIDDQQGMCWTSCRLGEVLRVTDQHDLALVQLHQAQWLAQRIGDRSAQASSMAEIGLVHRDRDEYQAAAAHCEHALGIAETIPDLAITAQVCTALAEINAARNDADTALRYARRAIALCQHIHNVAAEARAHDVLGDVHFANGDPPDAVRAWQHATDLYTRTGNPTRATLTLAKMDTVPEDSIQLPTARVDAESGEESLPTRSSTTDESP